MNPVILTEIGIRGYAFFISGITGFYCINDLCAHILYQFRERRTGRMREERGAVCEEVNGKKGKERGMNVEIFGRLLKQAVPDMKTIRELRIRAGNPVMILDESGENVLFSDGTCGKLKTCDAGFRGQPEKDENRNAVFADQELIRGILEICSGHSLYAYEREIGQGFLTIRGGHRVGIAGKAVVEDGRVKTVRDISSLNVRVAHEVKGCAKRLLPQLMDGEIFLDTLLISPPGAGKTTLLRDLIRELSCGGIWGPGKNVSVVDERSEIAACFGGIAQCDLGLRTDVMDGCPKAEGMLMMLRSMAPQVLAVDEAGGEDELLAMKYGMNCGCRILATVHGADIGDIMKRPAWRKLAEEKIFSRYVILSGIPKPGTVVGIYDEKFHLLEKSGGLRAGQY